MATMKMGKPHLKHLAFSGAWHRVLVVEVFARLQGDEKLTPARTM